MRRKIWIAIIAVAVLAAATLVLIIARSQGDETATASTPTEVVSETQKREMVKLAVVDSAEIVMGESWSKGGYERKSDSTSRIYMYVENSAESQGDLTLHIRRSNGESYGSLTAEPGTVKEGYTLKDCPGTLYRAELNCNGKCIGSGYISFD